MFTSITFTYATQDIKQTINRIQTIASSQWRRNNGLRRSPDRGVQKVGIPMGPWESHGNGNKLVGMGGNGNIRFSKIFPLSWVSHWLWGMIVLVLQLCILGLLLPKIIHQAN